MTGIESSRVGISSLTPISIGDLAIEPGTNQLYGIRSGDDGRNNAGELYKIDSATGKATAVGDTGTGADGGLGFAPDGTLYFASIDRGSSQPKIFVLDVDTAQIQSSLSVPGGSIGIVGGLDVRADGLIVITAASGTRMETIDVAGGVRTVVPLEDPQRGVAGDVAFLPRSAGHETIEVYHEDFENWPLNFTVDTPERAISGLWHLSAGRHHDGLISHTPDHNLYFGAFETGTGGGRYNVPPGDHEGIVISPPIQIPENGGTVMSFNYFLDTRAWSGRLRLRRGLDRRRDDGHQDSDA